jgi:hypothetical protein
MEEVCAAAVAVDPHHHLVAAAVVGPVEIEAGCQENVIEFAAAAAARAVLPEPVTEGGWQIHLLRRISTKRNRTLQRSIRRLRYHSLLER